MPLFRKPDDRTIDQQYTGLDDEMVKETLSNSEQQHLRFVRWGLRYGKGHFHEFLLDPLPTTDQDESSDD